VNIYEAMEYASRSTRVVRVRRNLLYTFGSTRLPYLCLSDSPRDTNEIVVRRGEVTADRPKIAIPGEPLQFEGFSLDGSEGDEAASFILARRIEMPPAKYVNKSERTTTETGPLDAAMERAVNRLDQTNDIRTAVIAAPDQVWTLSILLYVGSQVMRSAPANINEHLERLRLRGE